MHREIYCVMKLVASPMLNICAKKTITLYKNQTCPAMCLILHFVAIAFAHNAFYPRLVAAGLSPHTLHSFFSPDGQITINFTSKDNVLDIPVFRRSKQSLKGVHVDLSKALSANSISY